MNADPHSAATRFWSKVDKSGDCWLWTASTDRWGYGQFWFDRKLWSAHRFSYLLHHGDAPAPGLEVDHTCHNTICVNPQHLRQATRQQNSQNLDGPARLNNTSGMRGVTWDATRSKWRGQVVSQGRIYVRRFACPEDAERWVVAKRNEVYTHNILDKDAS